jgi:hypothetical protein
MIAVVNVRSRVILGLAGIATSVLISNTAASAQGVQGRAVPPDNVKKRHLKT